MKQNKKLLTIINSTYYTALLAGLISLFVYLAFALAMHIAPFGKESYLMFDMKRQYVDFYSYLRSVLKGENDIFYSFDTALGSGMLSFFVYYLSSPLNLFFCLFDKEKLPMAITLMTGFKVILCTVSMSLLLSHVNLLEEGEKEEGRAFTFNLLFSLSYAFSGYISANSMNSMWMEVYFITPVCLLFLDKSLRHLSGILGDKGRKGCILGYVISLSSMLLMNYYMSFMVCIFIVLYVFYFLIMHKVKSPFIILTKIAFLSMIGGLLDAWALIPTALDLKNSPKDIVQLGLEANKGNHSLLEVLSKLFSLSYDANQAMSGTAQIFAGDIVLLLVLLYFLNKKICLKEKLLSFGFMLIFFISFMLDKLNLIWHAGMEPSGYPYREAFLWVITALILSYRGILRPSGLNPLKVTGSGMAALLLLAAVSFKGYVYVDKRMLIINVLLITLFTLLILLMLRWGNNFGGFLTGSSILLFALSELLLNDCFIFECISMNNEKTSYYEEKIKEDETAVSYIKSLSGDIYRMENTCPRQQNDGLMYDYKGITHYSSAGKTYVRYFLQDLGFNETGLYTDYGHDNTMSADSLLAVRYLINPEQGIHPDYTALKYNVYENPYALSFANLVYKTPLLEYEDNSTNPFELQNLIFSDLLGEEGNHFADCKVTVYLDAERVNTDAQSLSASDENAEITDDILAKNSRLTDEVKNSETAYILMSSKDFSIFTHSDGSIPELVYSVKACKDGNLYFYMDEIEDYRQGMAVYLNGEFLASYGNAASYKVLNLGFYNEGDTLTLSLVNSSKRDHYGESIFVTERREQLLSDVEKISENKVNMDLISSSHIKLRLGQNAKDAVGILTSIPYENGWKIKAGSKDIEAVMAYGALMYIPLEGVDADCLELKFTPPGLKIGMIASVFALLLLLSFILFDIFDSKKQKQHTDKKQSEAFKLLT